MKNLVKLLGLFLITFCWNSTLQSQWASGTLNDPTYRNGDVGIGVTTPQAKLHLGIVRSGDIFIYDPEIDHPLTSPTSYPHIRLNTFIQKNGAITNTTVWDIDAPGSLDFRASLSDGQAPSLAMSISKYGGLTVYGNRFTLGNGDMNLNSGVGTSSFGASARYIGFGVGHSIGQGTGTYFNFAGGGSSGGAVIQGDANGNLLFLNKPDDGDYSIGHSENMNYTSMIIKADGKILIGTNDNPSFQGSNTSYKLYINGGAMAKEFVARVGWGDYVFEKDYNLLPLEKVEKHIEENGHLHNTPPAQEIEENGLPLGDMMVNQQVKIEEIFLHLIEMNKKLETLEKENQALIEELENLKK